MYTQYLLSKLSQEHYSLLWSVSKEERDVSTEGSLNTFSLLSIQIYHESDQDYQIHNSVLERGNQFSRAQKRLIPWLYVVLLPMEINLKVLFPIKEGLGSFTGKSRYKDLVKDISKIVVFKGENAVDNLLILPKKIQGIKGI